MACGFSLNYMLVDNDGVLRQSLRELKSLKPKSLLAMDCEGVNLSRKGELTIVAVATEEKAYIFDVVKLKQSVLDEGLREILEDMSRVKLMFDCRQDSDSLWHQYRVKLDGVLDVQLLEVMSRRGTGRYGRSTRGLRQVRRSNRSNEVEKIRGFKHCLELYVNDRASINTKEDGRKLLQRDRNLWKRRPLSDILLRYCAVDTLELIKLYKRLKKVHGEDISRLRVASNRYTDLFRSKTVRSFDHYESNGFLPLDVVPGDEEEVFANTSCNGCRRLFPREEFPESQIRFGTQKCRVCKRVEASRVDFDELRASLFGSFFS